MAIIVNRSNGPINIPGRMGFIRLRAGRDPVEIPDDALLDLRYLDAAVASGQISLVAEVTDDRDALAEAAKDMGIKVGKNWSVEKIEAAMRKKLEG